MKIKFFLIPLLIILFGLNAFAQEISEKVAEQVAKNFYYQRVNQVKSVDYNAIQVKLKAIQHKSTQKTFYIFDVNDNDGFVLVSAKNAVKPVLAYALKGSFNHDDMHPGQAGMLEWYEQQIEYVGKVRLSASDDVKRQWNELLTFSPERGLKSLRNVQPLLLVEWNQTAPYNAMCPEDAEASGGRVPVGCVATAMLQVMKHWNYPATGNGYYSHYSNYGTYAVNFGNQTYDWEGMLNKASGVNDEMAKINLHAGVAVRMNWGPDGSGSYTSRVSYALKNYFRYSESTEYVEKYQYSETGWKNLLRNQLDSGLPMVYSGASASSGHAWNCDGYMGEEFHMNWGWGGAGNGYYTLDNLVSSATPGGAEYNYLYGQDAVINIYPEANYPEHCSGSKTVVAAQGEFGDGSANEDYNNNIDCEYLIAPECGNLIRLEFDRFDLGDGDVVTLYDGATTDGNLLATFDADNLPETSTINSNTGNILIRFQTDGNSAGKGWDVSFDSDYCGLEAYTAQSGTVSDGSGLCDYKNTTVCLWYIEPEGAEAVRLDFTEFDLAPGSDYVKVYENSYNTSNLVEVFDASNVPQSIVVNAPKATLLFSTNSDDNVGGGWSANYNATVVNIEASEVLNGVNVYPNPANNEVNLAFGLSQSETVNIRVYDMLGKTMAETNLDAPSGYQNVKLSQFVEFSESGLYFVDLKVNGEKVTRKISILK